MKIAITGSSGLVGINLVKRLEGQELLCLDRSLGCDLQKEYAVEDQFFNFKPEVVIHLAAMASESMGQIAPVDMTQRNIGIFVNVLKAAINSGVKRFIYTSSVAVYGEATVPYKEDGPTIPKDVYGVNKLACEQILKIMAKVYGFEYVIVRPHNIYGPHQNMSDLSKNVVALFMRKLIEAKPYTLFGNGEMKRAFSYVDDVVEVLATSITDKKFTNKTLNIGSDEVVSIKDLSDLIQAVTGITGQVEMKPGRPQEISMFLADHTLQNSLIEYKDTSLLEGLQKTWKWAKKKELEPLLVHEREIYV